MGTGAILRKDILITIMGMAAIITMVTERSTIMGMELTQRKVGTHTQETESYVFFNTLSGHVDHHDQHKKEGHNDGGHHDHDDGPSPKKRKQEEEQSASTTTADGCC